MKYLLVLFIVVFFCQSCSRKTNITVIRQNFFIDKSDFSLNKIDTNKVNLGMYKNLLDQVNEGDSLFLYEIQGTYSIWGEYGLFNYRTKEYFYATMENKYKFQADTSTKSKIFYERFKEYLDKPEQYFLSKVHQAKPSKAMDAAATFMSIIKVKNKNDAFVKSYYF